MDTLYLDRHTWSTLRTGRGAPMDDYGADQARRMAQRAADAAADASRRAADSHERFKQMHEHSLRAQQDYRHQPPAQSGPIGRRIFVMLFMSVWTVLFLTMAGVFIYFFITIGIPVLLSVSQDVG